MSNKFGNKKFGEGWERPTFEEEYTRSREDREFEELEKKIGAETIDCRTKVTPDMRRWFRETYGFMADDESICKRWNEREDEK